MSRSLKIGFVFDDSLDKPDGVQQYVLCLGDWLVKQGHEVHYLVGKTNRTDLANVHSLSRNVNVSFNGNKMSIPLPTNRQKLAKLLNDEQFDVLHVQMPYSPWLAHRLIMAAPESTKVVGTFHIVAYSKLVQLATRLLAIWTRRSLQRFSGIGSVSSAAQAYARVTYGIDSQVIPNVFDYVRFQSAAPLLSAVIDKVRLLFLGRLVERKGCQYLLEAAQILQKRGLTNFELIICGRGGLQPQLESYALTHKIPASFRGFVTEADKPGIYASADIAVFPSTGGESFGIVLVEAMASGRAAVLAANNSGYASVLSHQPEQLFPAKDSTALADLLANYIADAKLRQQVAQAGSQYAYKFDVSAVGQQIIRLYDS